MEYDSVYSKSYNVIFVSISLLPNSFSYMTNKSTSNQHLGIWMTRIFYITFPYHILNQVQLTLGTKSIKKSYRILLLFIITMLMITLVLQEEISNPFFTKFETILLIIFRLFLYSLNILFLLIRKKVFYIIMINLDNRIIGSKLK